MLRRKKANQGSEEIDLKKAVAERRAVEDEEPWFLTEDDAPELEIETNRSFWDEHQKP